MVLDRLTGLTRPVIRVLRRKTVLALIFCLSFAYCMTSLYYGHRYALSSSSRFPVDYGDGDGSSGTMAFRRVGGMMQMSDDQSLLPPAVDQHDRRPQYFNDLPDYGSEEGNKQHNSLNDDKNKKSGDLSHQVTGDKDQLSSCRNSVQGKVLMADERGFTCHRKDVRRNGCCDPESASTRRYSCDTCDPHTHCCAIFEFCTSCCLDPGKKDFLSRVIAASTGDSKTKTTSSLFPSSVLYASLTDHFDFCLARCRTSSHSVQHENSYRDPKAKHCYGPSQAAAPAAEPSVPTGT